MAIYDVSLTISDALPLWPGDPQPHFSQPLDLERGDPYTLTRMDISVHTGTHVDAPAHFWSNGATVEELSLDVLVGPAAVVHAPDAELLSASVLSELPIPEGAERVLFATRNSNLWEKGSRTFQEDFVAISQDGAGWLVERGVRLVGVDYLSVGPFCDPTPAHRVLLGAGVVAIEGLNLSGVPAGMYTLVCLPLKIKGAEAAPARVVLLDL